MTINKAMSASLLTPLLLAGVISGCSNGSSSSSNISFYVQAGQEDIEEGLVRVVSAEGGQLSRDAEGRLSGTEYVTDEQGEVNPRAAAAEIYYFELLGHVAEEDTGVEPTTVRCQWAAGCTAGGSDYSFGADVARIDGLGWRAVAYDISSGERVRLTPLTDLAAQLAFDYVYDEGQSAWTATGYYSPYSVEQSISQVSQIFGIDSVESREPTDLTELSRVADSSSADTVYSIRYGALIAAWYHLSESYSGDFAADAAAEFSANAGQMTEADDGSAVLTLQALYSAAVENLEQIAASENISGTALTSAISGLNQDIASLSLTSPATLTSVRPATLEELFGTSDLEDLQLGLSRAKAFVQVLRDYENTFFEDGYRETADAYMDMLKAIGEENQDDLNLLIDQYIDVKDLYVATYLQNTGVCADTSAYAWMSGASCSYSSATAQLTLTGSNGTNLVVTQKVADVNLTDEEDEPTESHAIDVLITGSMRAGDLGFVVDNTYDNDDPEDDILSPTGIRIYYDNIVSTLVETDSGANEILAYELRWSDFSIYRSGLPSEVNGTPVTQDDIELSGAYRIFYRGVRDPLDDPQNPVSDLRFNIDTVVLNGRVSDVIGDEDDDDDNYTTVYIAANAENASDYYPEKEWTSFNGFFTPNAANGYAEGSVQADLATYERGSQTISGQQVDYLDVKLMVDGVALEDSARYRFYPTQLREDDTDINRDDETDDLVSVFDIEICELEYNNGSWSVGTCDPKQRLFGERDTDQAINDLWEAGAFSRVTVPGRGEYFITWSASAGSDGCYVLDPLTSGTLDGTLYEPMVLGLSSARFTAETILEDQPDTAFDILVNARTADRYTLTAALSHDYSGLSTNGDIYYGTGSRLDRILVSYDTDSNYGVTGSLEIYKDGVSLTLDPGTANEETDVVDSTLGLTLNRQYTSSPMPYHYVTDEEGNYDICVTDNIAENAVETLEGAVYYLTFRGVVYGSIQEENGVRVIRYIDGSFETL